MIEQRPIYTYEQYRPAYPMSGNFVRLFRGTFEDNRDSLNPSMVYADCGRFESDSGPYGRQGSQLGRREGFGAQPI